MRAPENDTMIQRVTAAIEAEFGLLARSFDEREAEAIARAVMRAMRDPDLAMRKVCTFQEAEVTWPAMIDAALAEPSALAAGSE